MNQDMPAKSSWDLILLVFIKKSVFERKIDILGG
jgi:hypothetical protein